MLGCVCVSNTVPHVTAGPGIKPVEDRNIEFLEEVAVGVAK